ncbi:MAG: hypothetical protein ACE5HM_02050 [Acidiferrobacterales bacterium]
MQHRDRDIYLSVFPKLLSRIGVLFFTSRWLLAIAAPSSEKYAS